MIADFCIATHDINKTWRPTREIKQSCGAALQVTTVLIGDNTTDDAA